MIRKNEYPVYRVFWGFLLSPSIGGAIIGLVMASILVYDKLITMGRLSFSDASGVLAIPLISAIFGEMLFIVPALIIASFCVRKRFYRNLKSYVWAALIGGLGALLWMELAAHYFFNPGPIDPTAQTMLSRSAIFMLGALSCLFVGFFVFPIELRDNDVPEEND